jgi:hypothetical protein
MTPQEALQRARDLFGPGTHIQVEITYGRLDLGDQRHAYWIFAGDIRGGGLCSKSEASWEEAIEGMRSRQMVKETALKGILGGAA